MLAIFHRCYARHYTAFAPPTWQRTTLPGVGALGEQEAWLMAALDYTRDVMNRLEVDLLNEARRTAPKSGAETTA